VGNASPAARRQKPYKRWFNRRLLLVPAPHQSVGAHCRVAQPCLLHGGHLESSRCRRAHLQGVQALAACKSAARLMAGLPLGHEHITMGTAWGPKLHATNEVVLKCYQSIGFSLPLLRCSSCGIRGTTRQSVMPCLQSSASFILLHGAGPQLGSAGGRRHPQEGQSTPFVDQSCRTVCWLGHDNPSSSRPFSLHAQDKRWTRR